MATAEQARAKSPALSSEATGLPAHRDHAHRAERVSGARNSEQPIAYTEASSAVSGSEAVPTMSAFDMLAYQRDVLERSILFFDTLRKRANAMLEHEHAGLPALLNFKSEMIHDARRSSSPSTMRCCASPRPVTSAGTTASIRKSRR